MERVGLAVGLVGFVLQTVGIIVAAVQGDRVNVVVLRMVGVSGIIAWTVWVTASLIRRQGTQARVSEPGREVFEGYRTRAVFFDSSNRNFLGEVRFGSGDDAKGTDLVKVPLANATAEGAIAKIVRVERKYRWIMSVATYQNTSKASNDRHIPGDSDPRVQGEYVRFIGFQFKSRVEKEPQEISVRLRTPAGTWLKQGTSNEWAARRVRVSQLTWEEVDGLLGPIRADQPCYVSFEIMPGPVNQPLYLRDIRIVELREAMESSEAG